MKQLGYETSAMDLVDEKILTQLIKNARTTTAELARLVRLSPPSVAERIKRLEEAEVITGYSAKISPKAIGLPIAVWLRIRPVPGEMQRVAEILQAIPEITQCDRVTGDDCYLARANLTSVADLERVIDLIIPYAMTNTAVIQSSLIEPRIPPFGTEN